MKDIDVSPEVKDVTAALLSFIDRDVLPLEDRHRELLDAERNRFLPDGRFHPDVLALRKTVRMRSAEAGFYTLFGAEELGGEGLGPTAAAFIQESLNRHVGPGHVLTEVVLPSPFTNGLTPVLRALAPSTLEPYLPGIASGERTLCFGLSEPDAGSDVLSMRTRAEKVDGGWLLNGTKQWITNAPYADYAMIFAVSSPDLATPGITGFFIETDSAGFEARSVIPIMGHLGGETGIITLANVFVPDTHVIGEVDQGLRVALHGVGTGRMSMAATCVGLARWALEQAVVYSQQRVTFGRPIAEHQAIQFHLAEMAMDIYAAKSMVQDCAWRVENSTSSPVLHVSAVKAFATEMLYRVMDRAVHVHGAMGLTNELRLEEGLRIARTLRVPDGTAEIQRRTIARRLLSGQLDI